MLNKNTINIFGMRAMILAALAVVLTGCNTAVGARGGVIIGDPAARTHLDTQLTGGDYAAFAEALTDKMLSSRLVQSWGNKRPRIIVGRLINNTHDENIIMSDVHDRITETLLNSGLVRVVDKSSTHFDYIVKSKLTDTKQGDQRGRKLAYYTLFLKMYKVNGELVGQWSDDLPLIKR